MQNTPPVARGAMLWAFQTWLRGLLTRWSFWGTLARRCELVKQRFRMEEWTEWAPGVLESLGAADEPPAPPAPPSLTLEYRAGLLFDLGMDFARVAEVLQVTGEELLRAVPRVDTRVLLPSARAYSQLSAVQRLKEESW